ncbi:hypothetical protein ACQKM9_00815 [Viridibacillus sp. NPDC093762]
MQKNSRHYYITVVSFIFRREKRMKYKLIVTVVVAVLAEALRQLQDEES